MRVVPQRCSILVVAVLVSLCLQSALCGQPQDLSQRPLPQWYQDAKLGIFIHWGIYSVPAFAEGDMTLEQVSQTLDFKSWFTNMPYAAWYQNSMKIEGSPTSEHHKEVYGTDFGYEEFDVMFNKSIQAWDPQSWAQLFKQAGANYVVLTSKHHDGFLLWPSEMPNPFQSGYQASRDIVGELSQAVREQGLRMGLYYSSGLDWTFNSKPITDIMSFFQAIPQQQEYVDYMDAHWRELIHRYTPSVLWADIGSPNAFDAESLLKHYYAIVPEGVVNDRLKTQLTAEGVGSAVHHDFTTAEYTVLKVIAQKKWESTRGIGRAFAYNQMEDEQDYLTVDQLVDMFIDIVSKNGNFLLNVGPRADGTIPEAQQARLLGLGHWLQENGEAIYGSTCWERAEALTQDGVPLRFTRNHGNLYVFLLERPEKAMVQIPDLVLLADSTVQLLGEGTDLEWQQQGKHLGVRLPDEYPESEAYVLRITDFLP